MRVAAAGVVLLAMAMASEAGAESFALKASSFRLIDSSDGGSEFQAPGLSLLDERLAVKRKTWWVQAIKEFEFDLEQDALTLALSVSVPDRQAHFGLGHVPTSAKFGLRLESDVDFSRGNPTIRTKVNLGLAGKRYSFDLPELTIVPRSHQGRRYLEYRIPLLQAAF